MTNVTTPGKELSLLIAFEKYHTEADLDPIQHRKQLISEANNLWRLRFIIDESLLMKHRAACVQPHAPCLRLSCPLPSPQLGQKIGQRLYILKVVSSITQSDYTEPRRNGK